MQGSSLFVAMISILATPQRQPASCHPLKSLVRNREPFLSLFSFLLFGAVRGSNLDLGTIVLLVDSRSELRR